MASRLFRGLVVATVTAGTCASARAQWSVVVLHPEGARWSECRAVSPTVQVGLARFPHPNIMSPPVLWTGSSSSWVSLSPQPGLIGEVYAVAGGQQAGHLNGQASIWSASAATHVGLNPAWAGGGSKTFATDGTTQAGSAYLTNTNTEHATLWHGTAGSAVDLHPLGSQYWYSGARALDRGMQGGFVYFTDPNIGEHAALWSGSAATFTDLNPEVGYQSRILGMASGIQVGYIKPPGVASHAAIWHGTTSGVIDLGEGRLNGTTGTIHVGTYFGSTGLTQAGIWLGSTPQSFLSLHQFLPPVYDTFSVATSVCEADGRIYVGGYAYRNGLDAEAVMWVYVPAPGSIVLPCALLALASRRRRG